MDEALRNVLMQLQGQFQDAQRQLQVVSQQAQARERDKKLSTLTLREIEALPHAASDAAGAATLYRGVGRMFMCEERDEIEAGLAAKVKASADEIAALEKKAKHYQAEMATAQGSLRDLLQQERTSD